MSQLFSNYKKCRTCPAEILINKKAHKMYCDDCLRKRRNERRHATRARNCIRCGAQMVQTHIRRKEICYDCEEAVRCAYTETKCIYCGRDTKRARFCSVLCRNKVHYIVSGRNTSRPNSEELEVLI